MHAVVEKNKRIPVTLGQLFITYYSCV